MPTIGNTATPSQAFGFYSVSSSNALAIKVTMPADGTITSITCYFSGHGATINPYLCLWDTLGNVIAQSVQLSVGAGTGGIGGQAFHSANVVTPVFIASGAAFYIGFWRPANQSDEWTENNGGTEYQHTDAGNSSPPTIATWNTTSGIPSFYATYTAGKVKVRRSGVWVSPSTIKVRRSGAWATPSSISVRRSGAWVPVR